MRITSPAEESVHPTAPVRLEVQLRGGGRSTGFRAYLNHRDVTERFASEGKLHAGALRARGDGLSAGRLATRPKRAARRDEHAQRRSGRGQPPLFCNRAHR